MNWKIVGTAAALGALDVNTTNFADKLGSKLRTKIPKNVPTDGSYVSPGRYSQYKGLLIPAAAIVLGIKFGLKTDWKTAIAATAALAAGEFGGAYISYAIHGDA